MCAFDYDAPAELYIGHKPGKRRQPLKYLRFPNAAQAIRYAVEDLTSGELSSAAIETGDIRLTGDEIRSRYEAAEYPLPHSAPKPR